MLYGNADDIISFKLYDHENNEVLDYNCVTNITFIINDDIRLQPIQFYSVAEVDGVKYGSLQGAYDAVEDNGTIKITNDSEGAGLVINKNITIDFNGKTYTFNEGVGNIPSNGFQILAGNNVTLKNGSLNVAEEAKDDIYILVQNYANLNVQDMNLDGKVELTGGQFYTNNTNLTVVAKKDIKGAQTIWNTISTPIIDAEIPTAEAGIHDLYCYDEENMTWRYFTGSGAQNPFTTLKLGQGYLYANTDDVTVALEGTLNISDVTFPLGYTEGNSLTGFNMVGNPFAFNITLANFATEAQLADGFYTIGEGGAWIANPNGSTIAPMESVLVKADKAAQMTIKANANAKTRGEETMSYIAINVANANYNDIAYVSFNEGMNLDKINHRNAEIPMVSVPVEGKEFAIAMMSQDVTEIPVTFKAATMGEYTIGISTEDCEYSRITLVDRLTGEETNMMLEDYTFMATSNDNVNRFMLRLDNSQQTTDNSNFANINNGELIINNIEGNAVIRVLDVLGRPVSEYRATESIYISTAAFRSGVYMIQMMDNNGVKVQKIIID